MEEKTDKTPFFKAYLQESLNCGWIDREGKFYGCAFGNHDSLVESMGFEAWEVEEKGWIRIADTHWVLASSISQLTPNQSRTLKHIGRCPDDRRYRDTSLKFEDVFSPQYNERLISRVTKRTERARQEQESSGDVAKIAVPSHLRMRRPF